MKPRGSSKYSGSHREEKGANPGEKKTAGQTKPTQLVLSRVHGRPFAGKVFYLDLPSNKTTETLESDIKDLGGIVEKFFSKEIKYLVSSKREAKYVHSLRKDSPVPSPDSGRSSPHLLSNSKHSSNQGNKSQPRPQADAFATSRGKSLVEKVVKEQGKVQMDRMLSNALEWGVKILYISDVVSYVQKKKKLCKQEGSAVKTKSQPAGAKQSLRKTKAGRISKPFIKVEDLSKLYRPIYVTFPKMPEINLNTVAPHSPFLPNDKDTQGTKLKNHKAVKASISEEKAQGRKKNREKKCGGYCECCMLKYNNLSAHLQTDRHRAFAKSDEYTAVDSIASILQRNFPLLQTNVKSGRKCSVSSVLTAQGLCNELDQRQEENDDRSETYLAEELQSDGEFQGLHPGEEAPSGSSSCSPPLPHARNGRGNYDRNPNTHTRVYPTRERTCKQAARTRKVEQKQIPRFLPETGTSDETVPSIPGTMPQLHTLNHSTHENRSSFNSRLHETNISLKVSGKSVGITKHEDEDVKRERDLCRRVQEGGGDEFSEREEHSLTQNVSPVKKIQRKIKMYKHKRRKLDPSVEEVRPSSSPDESKLKLWKLFQSSDDTDDEFLGFLG